MQVTKIVTKSGRVYHTKEQVSSETIAENARRLGWGEIDSVSIMIMSEEEYGNIPADIEADSFFGEAPQ
jgi:hypothetical protein